MMNVKQSPPRDCNKTSDQILKVTARFWTEEIESRLTLKRTSNDISIRFIVVTRPTKKTQKRLSLSRGNDASNTQHGPIRAV